MMLIVHALAIILLATTTQSPSQSSSEPPEPGPRITVASYYFGNYHPGDPRNVKNKGPGWSEWDARREAHVKQLETAGLASLVLVTLPEGERAAGTVRTVAAEAVRLGAAVPL